MKTAIIIGATSGLGREAAARLVTEGWKVGISVYTFDWRFRLIVGLWKMIPRFVWERLTWIQN